MKLTTLCFLRSDHRILLALKKRGFGAGKWNGVGGKVQEGESITESLIREIKEEIGVDVEEKNLKKCAELTFYFRSNPNWDQLCHVFFVDKWQGEPTETEEMNPAWFHASKIPYDKMWTDDIYWLPKVLASKYIKTVFHFIGKGEAFDKYEVKEAEDF